jgi:tRNA(Ile)-lysidine synthase TilS/MesJ
LRKLAEEQGESIETAARQARYGFFANIAKKRRCKSVFVAHHADDQVETFLWNLFRGAGQSGLAGMSAETEHIVNGVALHMFRPLLGIWRSEIVEYIRVQKLRYREDASNASHDYTRNRIRNALLPEIEALFGGRNVSRSIWRVAEIVRAEDEWLDALTQSESTETLSVPDLRAQPVAQQRRRILKWLRFHGVPEPGFDHIEAVRQLVAHTEPAKVNLPGNWHARRREKKLFLEKPKP